MDGARLTSLRRRHRAVPARHERGEVSGIAEGGPPCIPRPEPSLGQASCGTSDAADQRTGLGLPDSGPIVTQIPRIVYLSHTLHEVNGVARTARVLTEYARRNDRPFLCVRPSAALRHSRNDSVESLELPRSSVSIRVEEDLWQDSVILRYSRLVRKRFVAFRPDIVHITSMTDFGLLRLRLAREFNLPLVATWHTNVHQYAALRFETVADFLPSRARHDLSRNRESRACRLDSIGALC